MERLLGELDKERLTVEFKQSKFLENGDGQKKLAYEIVALVNRRGGKLLLGITDEGAFEGKGIFEVGRDKGIIDNICANSISPPVEYDVELLQCDKGDVLIINISERKDIPHAYVVSRTGPEIKNRIYYIRTAYGKRLVTDQQLSWLFQHKEDPDFSYRFPIVLDFHQSSLQSPFSESLYAKPPPYEWAYSTFVQHLSEKALKTLKEDSSLRASLCRELTPYALILSFSNLFRMSWLIAIERDGLVPTIGEVDQSKPKQEISVDQIPLPKADSVLSSVDLDIREILRNEVQFRDQRIPSGPQGHAFYVPEGTELKIGNNLLELEHHDFQIEISLPAWSYGIGPHRSSPYLPLFGEDATEYVGIECQLSVQFGFPEKDLQNFRHYLHYAKVIEDHLRHYWDWDRFREDMPSSEVFSMTKKLDEILSHIKSHR